MSAFHLLLSLTTPVFSSVTAMYDMTLSAGSNLAVMLTSM